MNSLLGHRKNDNKRSCKKPTSTDWQLVCAAGTVEEQCKRAQRRVTSTRRTTPVVHLVCSKHFCWDFESARRVPPALASRTLEVEALLVVPSLVRGLQADRRRDDVNGLVAHNQPLVFAISGDETATFGLQWCTTGSRPGDTGVAEDGEIRRWSVGALEAGSRSATLLKSPLRMTAPSIMQMSRMSNNKGMRTDLRLAD